jgi:hypothetical protein
MVAVSKQVQLKEFLNLFEMKTSDLPKETQSYNAAATELAKFKKVVRKKYHKIIFKHHPDHGGDEEIMKKVNELYGSVMASKPIRILPVPKETLIRVFTFHVRGVYNSGTGGSTTGDTVHFTF